jgi:hypothetical protein
MNPGLEIAGGVHALGSEQLHCSECYFDPAFRTVPILNLDTRHPVMV